MVRSGKWAFFFVSFFYTHQDRPRGQITRTSTIGNPYSVAGTDAGSPRGLTRNGQSSTAITIPSFANTFGTGSAIVVQGLATRPSLTVIRPVYVVSIWTRIPWPPAQLPAGAGRKPQRPSKDPDPKIKSMQVPLKCDVTME